MTFAFGILVFVTLQRIAELTLARRNTASLLARGAYEVAPGHYKFIVALHASWLLGLWLLAPWRAVSLPWLGAFVLLQLLRAWIILSLGERWTTRIIVLPGIALVRTGPYRFLKHPNYVVVAVEIAVLPLCFGLISYALLFSALNVVVLGIRIRAENEALARGSPLI